MIPSSPRLVAFAQSECDLTTPIIPVGTGKLALCLRLVSITGKKTPGEPGHTRDTRDTRMHKGTRTTQTNLTTIQTRLPVPRST